MVSALSRNLRGWAACAVTAAALIGGLVAMHGLASPAATAMPRAAHAQSASAQPMTGLASTSGPARTSAAPRTRTAAATPRLDAVPMGCSVDHANCVAVLPSQEHHSSAAISVLPTVPLAAIAAPIGLCTYGESRAPPDISLTRLCISRT